MIDKTHETENYRLPNHAKGVGLKVGLISESSLTKFPKPPKRTSAPLVYDTASVIGFTLCKVVCAILYIERYCSTFQRFPNPFWPMACRE